MIILSKITTKQGDNGETLLSGAKVSKTDKWISLIGDVDELNSALGVARTFINNPPIKDLILDIQNDLFDIGSVLYYCGNNDFGEHYISRLEKASKKYNEGLDTLRSFVIPGGNPPNAFLNLARSICRRVERTSFSLDELPTPTAMINISIYLNRLSDLLFILGRVEDGREMLWEPKREWLTTEENKEDAS